MAFNVLQRLGLRIAETLPFDYLIVRRSSNQDIVVQFAQKAVIVRDGQVLLVQRSSTDPNNPGRWELPGGRMQATDDLDQQIQREVLEEVGLLVEPAQPLHMWYWDMPAGRAPVRVVAVARWCQIMSGRESTSNCRSDDHISRAKWWALSALQDVDLISQHRDALSRAHELMGLRSESTPATR